MEDILHFDIQTEEPKRAVQFYRRVFGWQIRRWYGQRDSYLVQTSPPSFRGIIQKRNARVAMNPTQKTNFYTLNQDSIYQILARVLASGGKVITGKKLIPGAAMAFGQDTEGNIFGIIQTPSSI